MKQYHRYKMDFDGKAVWLSGIFMGLPIFLLVLHYLFLNDFTKMNGGMLVLKLWAPIALSFVYVFLIRIIRWNAPGVYAILGCLFCVWLIIGLFFTGNVLRIVLGIFAYLICGAVLIFSAGGFLPGRLPATVCFAVVLALRVVLFDIGRVHGFAWLPEAANLCVITGLTVLPLAWIPGRMKGE